ncbi:MAG: class I SAM-dependent methyltransferase [Planctomycetes bacterium]|nr:class I SAM-dependent methyltransferase [Planctomycetota bacterium]
MVPTKHKAATAAAIEEVPCDFCGAAEADFVLARADRLGALPGEWRVVRCRRCGLARTSPRPAAEALSRAYPDGYECHQGAPENRGPPHGLLRWALVNLRGYPLGRRSAAPLRWLLTPAAALRLRNRKFVGCLPYEGEGRLLDFGCGGGRYVAQMAAAGWKAEGIDLVPAAVRAGRAAGLVIHQGTLPGADLPPGTYDLVTMWHVLEHVPSPLATLRAVRDVLRPGGRLAVVCPMNDSLSARWFGAAWYGLDMPRHLTHFTRTTLRRHLEAAGFRVESAHSIRRPTFMRGSLALLADDTGRALYARLARMHVVARLESHVAALLGRTAEALFVARRRETGD